MTWPESPLGTLRFSRIEQQAKNLTGVLFSKRIPASYRSVIPMIIRRILRSMLVALRWGLISFLIITALYFLVIRPWHIHWGATDEEVSRAMPGDGIIVNPTLNTTRAITIRARPEEIWPWLVQMGTLRAGWYSYDRVDNGGNPSARRIIPELQIPLKAGDRMSAADHGGFRVLSVDPNHSLVLGPQSVWTFALYPQADGTTRFVQRLRIKYVWRRAPFAVMLDIGDFIMMRKMLLNMKKLVESTHAN